MLTVLESFLLTAVSPALPQNTKLIAGMIQPPLATELPLVNIIVNNVQTVRNASSEDNNRTPAFFNQRSSTTGDGKKLDFVLPIDCDVLEVEFTDGRLAKAGDDYWQDGKTLRFYQAPIGAFSVLVKGKPARGYQELSPCTANVSIDVWSDTHTIANNLLVPALAATLTALTNVDRIELARLDNAGFSLRLMKPVAELSGLERNPKTNSPLFCSTAQLLLRGELEMTLAIGTPDPQSIIQTIEGRLLNTSNPSATEDFKIHKNPL